MRATFLVLVSLALAFEGGLVLAQPKGKATPKPIGKVATEEEVDAHLKIIETKEGPAKINAARWFSKVHPPNEKAKARVARKLVETIEDPTTDAVTIGRCGEALPNWATEEIAPKLLTYMLRGERKGAMIALGRLKYEKAIPEFIRSVESGKDRSLALKALIDMGPKAEGAVLKLLDLERNKSAVKSGCLILREIGTKKSLPALERLSKLKDKDIAHPAASAIEAVEERDRSGDKK